jgi:hypothetical protein
MKATTTLPDSGEAGFALHTIAGMSWKMPHARHPYRIMSRLSTTRTIKRLKMTPRRPMHVIMMENPKGFLTPAMARKYVVYMLTQDEPVDEISIDVREYLMEG